ncbi:MAG TPA: hypothetical protein P5201_06140, partial [Aminobacteriaceae bacterium]|nr:hypothetical protein [Aminobacteriaceae bacterium]
EIDTDQLTENAQKYAHQIITSITTLTDKEREILYDSFSIAVTDASTQFQKMSVRFSGLTSVECGFDNVLGRVQLDGSKIPIHQLSGRAAGKRLVKRLCSTVSRLLFQRRRSFR